ncbi:MAG: D-TA family PLP-dependent enzyme [Gemmatimonadaceae bacterium]|nr:D-TA family PLP-dependent enzyme [Gemmatimonadaceae bacterium]
MVSTSLADLETPIPLVDLDRLDRNLDRMAAYASEHGLALRPHIKTHKSPRIAAEQLQRGAVGVTCATVREAEVMSEVASDILVAYPILGSSKLQRLMALPPSVRITVALDSAAAVEQLAAAAREHGRTVGVYVEIDGGMHRVGVSTPDEAVALARLVTERAPLEYAGIAFYPGHIRQGPAEQQQALAQLARDLHTFTIALERAGLPPQVVSGGSTPTAWRTHEIPEVTEFRPGTYVYNDRTSAAVGACTWDDCAFTVLATVVSTAVPGQAVIDAGTKALGREPVRGVAGEGFGALLDRPEVTVRAMSEEHGILDLSTTDWRPAVGDLVRVVPNHVCIVVHLNDVIYGVRGDTVESCWPVAARGRGQGQG